ncbi:ZIP family metal transporter [Paenibacillus sp. TRM 82003]|nr:ZIP family metal transporter [Paenibacillus sp. TRM 82003]
MYNDGVMMAISALSTCVGAIPALFLRRVSHRWMDTLLAYTAGVMVAAATYGLIPESLKLSNLGVLFIGIVAGATILSLIETTIPHVDPTHDKGSVPLPAQSLMVAIAMALHNVPEGFSVGAGMATPSEDLGLMVAFAIGLQNAPEGFLVALFLINQKVDRRIAVAVAGCTGIIELMASFVGFQFASLASSFVPYGLALASGSMLFIVYKELIPETHGHGYERSATFAFLFGLLSMIGLVEVLRH